MIFSLVIVAVVAITVCNENAKKANQNISNVCCELVAHAIGC
jgi:hypothetical protein